MAYHEKEKITRGDVSGVKVNEKEAGKMADLSKKAKLSQVYTNHCLRATAATVLGHKGSIGRESMLTRDLLHTDHIMGDEVYFPFWMNSLNAYDLFEGDW